MLQHCSNIVPRLYRLITVGCVCIKSKEAPAKDILKDPVEMCRGVQHTSRGVLLGNYLLTQSKSMLPGIIYSHFHGLGQQLQGQRACTGPSLLSPTPRSPPLRHAAQH